jgi:hypothetical protein
MSHSMLVCLEARLVAVRSAARLHIKEVISLDQTNGTDEKYQLARIATYDVPASA